MIHRKRVGSNALLGGALCAPSGKVVKNARTVTRRAERGCVTAGMSCRKVNSIRLSGT